MGRRALAGGLAAPVALMIAEPAQGSLYASTLEDSLKLVRLDPDTLRPLAGRTVPLAREPLGWSFAPDRSRLVTGSTARGARLRFIDLRRMRHLGVVTVSRRGSGVGTAWVGPRRGLSVVATAGCSGAGDTVVAAVDSETRRVLWRRRLGGSLQAGERLDGSVLLVLGPRGQALGPSRLVQVGRDGPIRSAELPEIISGTQPGDVALASGTLLASCYLCHSRGGLSGFSLAGRRRFHLFGRGQVVGGSAAGPEGARGEPAGGACSSTPARAACCAATRASR
jgi:hypothetical protein